MAIDVDTEKMQQKRSKRTADSDPSATRAIALEGKKPKRVNTKAKDALARIFIVLGVLFIWYAVTAWTSLDPLFAPSPVDVFGFLVDYLQRPEALVDSWATIRETAIGFLISVPIGIGLGLLLGGFDRIGRLFRPFVTALQAAPLLALVPLAILWFGLGSASKVALIVANVTLLVLISTEGGVKSVDREWILTTRALGATPWQMQFKVIIPGAMPGILAGMRLAISFSVLGAVIGEMLGGNDGWGVQISRYQAMFDSAAVIGLVMLTSLFAVLLNAIMMFFEAKLFQGRN